MKKLAIFIISVILTFALAFFALANAKGDVDGDGEITASDARLCLRAAVGLEELTKEQWAAADTDGDGEITASDARLTLRAAVGLEPWGNVGITWKLSDDGTLTISGRGAMENYRETYDDGDLHSSAPWCDSEEKAQRIKKVVIEDGITSIGRCAFRGCWSLTSVTIPDSVTSIGELAFWECRSLTSVMIPASVTSIGDEAFFPFSTTFGKKIRLVILCYKNSFAHEYVEKENIAYGLIDGSEEENTFSGEIGRLNWRIDRVKCELTLSCSGGMPNFSAGIERPWGSEYKNYVHSAVIGDGAANISDQAFSDCWSLTSVTIPDSVTSIGDEAFSGCDSLTSVTIPDSVTSIGGHAFYDCSSLTSVTIPDSVTSIGDRAFSDCSSLTSVTIPDSVTSIGDEAFYRCSSLTNVTIPDSVTIIEIEAFSGCKSLTSMDIPANVDYVSYRAFANCDSLEKICFYNRNCEISDGATPTNTVVCGYKGSTAEAYAESNGLNFKPLEGNHTHEYVEVNTVPATCTEPGSRELVCACGARKTEEIPAKGHTVVNEPRVAPTCTEPGFSAWSYCSVCKAVLTEKKEIPAAGHKETVVGAAPANCTADGFTGVTYCTVCKQVLDPGSTIPAAGHKNENGDAFCDVCGEKLP